jgi:hypothetical protein
MKNKRNLRINVKKIQRKQQTNTLLPSNQKQSKAKQKLKKRRKQNNW